MVSIALKISEDFKSMIDKFPWINWSEIARDEAMKKIQLANDLEEFRRIVSKSKLTKKDALELGRKVNEGLYKRYKELYPELK